MNSLVEYAEALVRPVEVTVIDPEEHAAQDIFNALSVYNCQVNLITPPLSSLQILQPCGDLVFLADEIPGHIQPVDILQLLEGQSPTPSVVILTRKPSSDRVAALMKYGPYTFMVKNGSFNGTHVRRVFCQLNLRLRGGGQPTAKEKMSATCVV